ncbi:MAG TPA: DUF805 domain-containing protein [Anaerolineales bacterium]
MKTKMSLSQVLFSFAGRIPRSTFWYYLAGYAVLWVTGRLIDTAIQRGSAQDLSGGVGGYGCFGVVIGLLGIFTGLAVLVKRLHDRDRPGWHLLYGLIPVAGQIWLLVELGFRRGTTGWNEFGLDPFGEGKDVSSQVARAGGS